jgi:hypothetical protein
LKGTHGYNGWQWIFIIEGAATIGLGVLAWLFAADFPETSRFVNEEERKVSCLVTDSSRPCLTTLFLDDP